MLPIETVVELLMQSAYLTMIGWGHCLVEENQPTQDELRSKLRDYLLTLVPKPVLLSECEEGKWFIDDEGEAVMRDGNHVLRASRENGEWSSFPAKDFKVIQPVEVQ